MYSHSQVSRFYIEGSFTKCQARSYEMSTVIKDMYIDYFFLHFRQLSSRCQMMFFSATYEKDVMEFAEYIVPNPIVIGLAREQESLDNIKQYYVRCTNQEEKYQAISNIYGVITVGQAIIFCHVMYIFLILITYLIFSHTVRMSYEKKSRHIFLKKKLF